MTRRSLNGLQNHISDPEVLAAVITAYDYRVEHGITIQPNRADDIIKQGKGPAAESVAPVVTDEKLLLKLSRDSRKGVRQSVLRNPNLGQEHLENILRKALKSDADYEVALPAAHRLEDDVLLSVLGEHVRSSGQRVNDLYLEVGSVAALAKASYYAQNSNPLSYELAHRLPKGGVEYQRKLHEIGFNAYFLDLNPREYSAHGSNPWYQAGMLTWMVPEMEVAHVPYFLANLLHAGATVSLEDVQAADQVMKANGLDSEFSSRWGQRAKLDDDTMRALYDMGGHWRRSLRQSDRLPEDLQMKFLANLSLEELQHLHAPSPDPNFLEWKPVNVPEDTQGPDNCNNWQSPDVVNIFGKRWSEALKSDSVDPRSTPLMNITESMTQYVRSVHPDRRKALSPEVLTLTAMAGVRPGRGLGAEPIRDWALGVLDVKPSNESVASILVLAQKMDEWTRSYVGTATTVLRELAGARRVSYFLGDALKAAGDAAMSVPEVVYLVFKHYFGDDPEAWVVAIDLASNWEDGLEDLALTAAAATGLETPEEVIDLADLEATDDESDEESSEEEPEAAVEVEHPEEVETPAEESSDPADEPQEEASEEEPADVESTEDTEEGDTAEDETSDEEDSEEDITPLDITTPVMFTLF